MRQRLLLQLMQAPRDLDYVGHFQELSRLNLEMRRFGPSAQRLLRKTMLEREVGNYGASLGAAQDALLLDPNNPEMHYHLGIAFVYVALARADALPIGAVPQALPHETATTLLQKGAEAFRTVLNFNPRDEDAQEDLAAVERILEDSANEAEVCGALRSGPR
jgi:tetratricopeptide (TPR) repeat protein